MRETYWYAGGRIQRMTISIGDPKWAEALVAWDRDVADRVDWPIAPRLYTYTRISPYARREIFAIDDARCPALPTGFVLNLNLRLAAPEHDGCECRLYAQGVQWTKAIDVSTSDWQHLRGF